MATCDWCHLDMTDAATKSCTQKVEFPDGEMVNPVPYTHWGGNPETVRSERGVWSLTGNLTPLEEIPDGHRCHDCYIEKGGSHHPGCDMERCPRCSGQLISCGCLDSDDDTEAEQP